LDAAAIERHAINLADEVIGPAGCVRGCCRRDAGDGFRGGNGRHGCRRGGDGRGAGDGKAEGRRGTDGRLCAGGRLGHRDPRRGCRALRSDGFRLLACLRDGFDADDLDDAGALDRLRV